MTEFEKIGAGVKQLKSKIGSISSVLPERKNFQKVRIRRMKPPIFLRMTIILHCI